MPPDLAPAITTRTARAEIVERLAGEGVPPLLARIYAARGVTSARDLVSEFEQLAAPDSMQNLRTMAGLLAAAIASRRKLLIVADYDADGATACAVGVRALRAFGADVGYLVPNRFEYGYGLTPEIVRLAQTQSRPDILITVDNGIASFEGVEEANRLGMQVLITDHHLPAEQLPDAACIINPNQPGCTFPSKHLAGVGVMFYLMLALRSELRARGAFASHPSPITHHSSRFRPALDGNADPLHVLFHRELADAHLDPRRLELRHHELGEVLGQALDKEEALLPERRLDALDDFRVVDRVADAVAARATAVGDPDLQIELHRLRDLALPVVDADQHLDAQVSDEYRIHSGLE